MAKSETTERTGYVCVLKDLDMLLPDELVKEFKGLFYQEDGHPQDEAWRMFCSRSGQSERTPESFFARFGVDWNNLRVRDAVAMDLIKLDDGTVSNDYFCTVKEQVKYSPNEMQRFLLNKNFRVNLVNLEREWSNISYTIKDGGDEDGRIQKLKRNVERMHQGIRMSNAFLEMFNQVFKLGFDESHKPIRDFNEQDIYIPFTNANDFHQEVALIPNTHPDFKAVTSRAYYDLKHRQYVKRLRAHGIHAVASFALIDKDLDKSHNGDVLVKIQRKVGDGTWQYIVAKVDSDGQLKPVDGNGGTLFRRWTSNKNEILSVCEQDFLPRKTNVVVSREWQPVVREVPVAKSTTSSHWSVFMQRIPNHDFKNVRNYVQFKTRLKGMELCLVQLKRDVYGKEVQCSECFNKMTISLWRMMQELVGNKERLALVEEWYRLVAEYDELFMKRTRLVDLISTKKVELDELLEQYNKLGPKQMDEKFQLGAKIKSMRLEIDKNHSTMLESLKGRLEEIERRVDAIKEKMDEDDGQQSPPEIIWDSEEWERRKQQVIDQRQDAPTPPDPSEYRQDVDASKQQSQQHVQDTASSQHADPTMYPRAGMDGKLKELDFNANATKRLRRLVRIVERWRGYMFNLGYELSQMKQMLVKCEDATIKVKRLLRNFEDKIRTTQKQVWNKKHQLRKNFDFKGVALAGIHDIILLHDWYAANAGNNTFSDMGFKDEDEFMEFRRRCNKISYNLRKNQYMQMLQIRKT